MTPAEFADRIDRVAGMLAPHDPDFAEAIRSRAAMVRSHGSPEVAGAMAILVRADLIRGAEQCEAHAAELRAWAREIGEG